MPREKKKKGHHGSAYSFHFPTPSHIYDKDPYSIFF